MIVGERTFVLAGYFQMCRVLSGCALVEVPALAKTLARAASVAASEFSNGDPVLTCTVTLVQTMTKDSIQP